MTESLHFVASPATSERQREIGQAVRRGLMSRCPNCGEGKLFRAYLEVADYCPACGEALYHQRTDDAPAYLTMFIVGHSIVAGILAVEEISPDVNVGVLVVLWSVVTAAASLLVLPRIKGALVGYQWATRMHGFGGRED
jgi:uncharacterized protein (DUF983 family)